MSERGTIAIDRGVFGHDRFADEPFTEREAWIWMIGQAAFRPHCRRVGRVRVELKRGQFAHSTRWMADQWKWSEAAVRRYLAKLASKIGEDDAMVTLSSDAGITVVTICNYAAYQDAMRKRDALEHDDFDADLTHTRRKEEALDKNVVGGEESPDLAKTKMLDDDIDVARQCLVAMGHEPDGPGLITMAYQVPMWRRKGIPITDLLAWIADVAGKGEKFRLSYYFAMIEGRARRYRDKPPSADQPHLPLGPVVVTSSSEAAHVQTDRRYSHSRSSGGFAAFARDRAKSAG